MTDRSADLEHVALMAFARDPLRGDTPDLREHAAAGDAPPAPGRATLHPRRSRRRCRDVSGR